MNYKLQDWEKSIGITENRFENHHGYYLQLANIMGIGWPDEKFMGKTKGQWLDLYKRDKHLNNHPLSDFDACYGWHRPIAARLKIPFAPSMTVCMLKAVIIEKVTK